MSKPETQRIDIKKILFYLLCGTLIGAGAGLPGISGGVMAVIFGIYRPLMDCISSPFKTLKKQWNVIIPAVLGIGIGLIAVSALLSKLLEAYESQSVCVFVGLIIGMLPALYKEAGEKGRNKTDFVFMTVAFAVIFVILYLLKSAEEGSAVEGGFLSFMFAGFCMALSLIVPGMSFSTFLMPMGLYTPLLNGIKDFDIIGVLIPAGIGGLVTVILLAKVATWVLDKYYSKSFHSIIGIVIAATVFTVPFESFTDGVVPCIVNVVCIILGAAVSLLFAKIDVKKE